MLTHSNNPTAGGQAVSRPVCAQGARYTVHVARQLLSFSHRGAAQAARPLHPPRGSASLGGLFVPGS